MSNYQEKCLNVNDEDQLQTNKQPINQKQKGTYTFNDRLTVNDKTMVSEYVKPSKNYQKKKKYQKNYNVQGEGQKWNNERIIRESEQSSYGNSHNYDNYGNKNYKKKNKKTEDYYNLG